MEESDAEERWGTLSIGRHEIDEEVVIWVAPYWPFVLLPTLLSAHLLLWPGKRPEKPPIPA